MVGFTLDEQDDRHSIASTVATTTSLASRIRDLNLDFGDKLREQAEEEEKEAAEECRSAAAAPEEDSDQPAGRPSEDHPAPGPGNHAAEDENHLLQPHSLHLLHRDPPLQPLQVRQVSRACCLG